MNVDRLLRGFLIVICAQVPLLALFIYLLFTGVGISDFEKLANLKQSNQPDYAALLEQRNQQLLKQMNTVIGQVNEKIETLETSLARVSSTPVNRVQPPAEWDTFLASGGPESIDNLATQLDALKTQLNGVDARVGETVTRDASKLTSDKDQIRVLSQDVEQLNSLLLSQAVDKDQIRILSQDVEQLKSQLLNQATRLETVSDLTHDLLSKEYPALQAEAPKREPVAELRFDVDAWHVGHKAEWALEKVIREAKNVGRSARINIYGFTVQNGPLNFSMALADKRARVVADVLRQKGGTDYPITIFVVPEYAAYRDAKNRKSGDKNHAVHIYVE